MLRSKHGADGKGLHQLVTSVERDLPPELVRTLRRVATIRNKIVHEDSYQRLDDPKGFISDCAAAKKQLRKRGRAGRRRSTFRLLVPLFVIIVAVLAILAYVLGWMKS